MQEKDTNQKLAVFSYLKEGNQFVFYIFRKITKVSRAIYIVTDLIKDNEPLKWSLRKTATEMSSIRNFFDEKSVFNSTEKYLLELESFLEFASLTKNISEMNAGTIQNEIQKLILEMREHSKEGFYSPELTAAFFDIPKPEVVSFGGLASKENVGDQSKSHKGHAVLYDFYNRVPSTPRPSSSNPPKQKAVDRSQDSGTVNFSSEQKGHRKDEMINIVRSKGEVTIKDITEKIKDCSEKTIQRELTAMVTEGVLKKTGERRWSKYSLKDIKR